MAVFDFNELLRISDAVSPHLKGVRGVTGVGVQVQGLTVYLEQDSEQVRDRVTRIVSNQFGNTPVHFEISGRFRALSNK